MAFCALFTKDVDVQRAVRDSLTNRCLVAHTGSWDRLLYLVRERPATCVVLDEAALKAPQGPQGLLAQLRNRFPSVAQVLITGPRTDPYALFRIGRAGIDNLILVRLDELRGEMAEAVTKARTAGAEALVTRVVSPYLPAREMEVVRSAFDGVQRGWTTRELARSAGLTRPHLSVRLKAAGLPSAGHLLVWARLLLAGHWLGDPGRTAQSVSRQLDYSSGAAFRRALHNYVGATPTAIREAGPLRFVLDRFLASCRIARPGRAGRSVA